MNRRDLLRSAVTASTVGAAGCGVLAADCEPTDHRLGDLADRVDAGENPGGVTVRGVISRPVEGDLVIADGTGVAIVNPPGLKQFNSDWFSEGECVTATGEVSGDYSRKYGVLNVDIRTEDDVETVGFGNAKGGSKELLDQPDVQFDVEFVGDGVRLTHTGSEAVPAKRLEIRHTTNDWADVTADRWHELGDADPEEKIEAGDAITDSRRGSGRLLWRADEHWARPVSSGWNL